MGLRGGGPAGDPAAFHLSPHGLHRWTPRRVAELAHPRRQVVVLAPEHIAQVLVADMFSKTSPRVPSGLLGCYLKRMRTLEERRGLGVGVGAGTGRQTLVERQGDDDGRRAVKEVTLKARSVSGGGGASQNGEGVGHAPFALLARYLRGRRDASEARLLWRATERLLRSWFVVGCGRCGRSCEMRSGTYVGVARGKE